MPADSYSNNSNAYGTFSFKQSKKCLELINIVHYSVNSVKHFSAGTIFQRQLKAESIHTDNKNLLQFIY